MKLLDIPPKYLNRELIRKIYNNKSLMKKYIQKYNLVGGSATGEDVVDIPAAAAPAADGVSWTVCCCDGATFSVALPDHARVAEAKRAIGVLREVSRFAMELFVEDEEEPLDDERRLSAADKVPLFMLPKEASDRLALEVLYKSCGGAGWTRKGGWMTEAGLGEWKGVTVDEEGRVTKLNLGFNNLVDPLPSELQQLLALKVLSLAGNKLTGPVPAELGQLGALTHLYLNENQLSGQIPDELGQLKMLQYLHLQGNQQLEGQEAFRDDMKEHLPDCYVSV